MHKDISYLIMGYDNYTKDKIISAYSKHEIFKEISIQLDDCFNNFKESLLEIYTKDFMYCDQYVNVKEVVINYAGYNITSLVQKHLDLLEIYSLSDCAYEFEVEEVRSLNRNLLRNNILLLASYNNIRV